MNGWSSRRQLSPSILNISHLWIKRFITAAVSTGFQGASPVLKAFICGCIQEGVLVNLIKQLEQSADFLALQHRTRNLVDDQEVTVVQPFHFVSAVRERFFGLEQMSQAAHAVSLHPVVWRSRIHPVSTACRKMEIPHAEAYFCHHRAPVLHLDGQKQLKEFHVRLVRTVVLKQDIFQPWMRRFKWVPKQEPSLLKKGTTK